MFKMRIALDVTPLSSGHKVRGIGAYTTNLVEALKQYDCQNSYIFFTRGERLPPSIDLVHYPYFEPFFLTLPLRKIAKTVVTIHDLIPLRFPDKFPSGVRGKIKWQIQEWSLKSVSAVITDSENSKKDIIHFTGFPESKIHVVYLAPAPEFRQIEDTLLARSIRAKYNLPKRFVLYVGDVTWNKNVPGLIKAIKIIDETLVIVGKQAAEKDFDRSNPWNKDLIEIEKMSEGDKRIIKLGFIPTEDLVAVYNLATVYCQPSFYEGFGLPILEAMACGTPVVATNTSSLPEICGDAAIFVDPYNENNIIRGISEVFRFNKTQYRNQVDKGLEWVKKFSWRKTAEETIKVYNET